MTTRRRFSQVLMTSFTSLGFASLGFFRQVYGVALSFKPTGV